MKKFTSFTSHAVPLEIDNVDTDQIIPGRFLTTTTSSGLGRYLFEDWRFDSNRQTKPDFVLNRPEFEGARILVAGHNFGCGSSREHAVWALADYGFRAVVSTSFADIFHANALRFGLVAVRLAPKDHRELLDLIKDENAVPVTIDLEAQALSCGSLQTEFDFDPFSKHCITRGIDELGYLLEQEPLISEHEAQNPALICTRG